MHDPAKLPVAIWAERKDGRTRIMISVPGDPPFELMAYPSDLPEKMANPQPLIIPTPTDN